MPDVGHRSFLEGFSLDIASAWLEAAVSCPRQCRDALAITVIHVQHYTIHFNRSSCSCKIRQTGDKTAEAEHRYHGIRGEWRPSGFFRLCYAREEGSRGVSISAFLQLDHSPSRECQRLSACLAPAARDGIIISDYIISAQYCWRPRASGLLFPAYLCRKNAKIAKDEVDASDVAAIR